MFAVIETKGASHIVIDVPVDASPSALPALTRMLENNCVLLQKSWRECEVIKSTSMTIVMGSTYNTEHDGIEFKVRKADVTDIIGDEFVVATPGVFVDFSRAKKKYEEEAQRLRNEIAVLRDKVAFLEAQATVGNE